LKSFFVDDGSCDNTYFLLTNFFKKYDFNKQIKVVKHKRNRGVGNALKTGIKNSTGDIIFQLDADVIYTPREILEMIEYLKNYDIVSVSPHHPKGRVEDLPIYRLFLSKLSSLIYRLISGSNIYTFTSSARAYKSNVIKDIKFKSSGFVCFAEIMNLALMKKYKVKEYPTTLKNRQYGESKMKTLNVIFEHLRLMIWILWIKITNKRV